MGLKRITHAMAAATAVVAFGVACNNDDIDVDPLGPEDPATDPDVGGTGGLRPPGTEPDREIGDD